jgi:hypothetical protein
VLTLPTNRSKNGVLGFAIIFVEVYNCFVELERVYEEKVYKI